MKKLNISNNCTAFSLDNLHKKLPILISLFLFVQIIAPFNNSIFAQWEQISPANGGTGSCFYVDDNEIFLGTRGSGIYYSSNYGETWESRNDGLINLSIEQIDKLGSILFASFPYGVYKSIDNGMSWEYHWVGQGESVYGLIVVDSLVFAGTACGKIFVSSDLGESWQLQESVGSENHINKFRRFDNTIFACVGSMWEEGGLLVSTDNGLNWQYENNGILNPSISDITKLNNSYYITDLSDGVYKSDGHEFTWTQVNNGIEQLGLTYIYAFNNCVFACTIQDIVYRTTDEGENWTKCADVLGFEMTSINDDLLLGVRGEGVLRSIDNGDSWMPYNNGLSNVYIYAVHCRGNQIYASIAEKGLYVSGDDGRTWAFISGGINSKNIWCVTSNENALFAGTEDEGLFRSFDGGQTWGSVLNDDFIHAIKTKGDTILVSALYQSYIYKSFNNGNTWIQTYPPDNARITDFEFIANVTVASTQFNGMYRSTNLGGNAWAQVFSWPNIVNELDKWGNTFFAATLDCSVMKSEDMGLTWESIMHNLPNAYAETIAVVHNNLIVGVWGKGLFDICADGGTEWAFISTVPGIYFEHQKFSNLSYANDFLFVAIEGHGLWRYPYPIMGENEIVQANDTGLEVSLNQSVLSVGLNPPRQFLHASLYITSMSGSTVYRSDFDGNQTKKIGTKSFTPGLYIVSIRSKGMQLTQKIIIGLR